jgi:hypothetical protein
LKIIELELELELGRLCRYPSTTQFEFEFHAAWCQQVGMNKPSHISQIRFDKAKSSWQCSAMPPGGIRVIRLFGAKKLRQYRYTQTQPDAVIVS